jgi:uncharacterized protein (TIGR03086 family)
MSDVSDRYRGLAQGFTDRVEAVPADRWTNQTPCKEWKARDVVQHMLDTHGMFLGFIGREVPPGPSVDDDPPGAWTNARDAVQAALDDPATAGQEYDGMFGPTTFDQSINQFICADLVVHTWDLARATGLDERLPQDEVKAVFESLRPLGDKLRSPGAFGPEVPPPEGADEQAKLLAFLGRAV